MLVLDWSEAMDDASDEDFRPTRGHVTLQLAKDFVASFFDRNPISQLSIVKTCQNKADRLTPLSGNRSSHVRA